MVERPTAAASKEAAPDPLIGRVINEKFKILGFIARGGMGKVYRAEQTPLGRVCAVKVLNPNYTGEHDPEFHKRFFLEASMTSKLRHPNTVTIFDYGHTEDGIYYMAMEYLEGYTLHRAIRQVGHLPEERAAHIARQICRSLREAHSLGVVHRDLKPANVYLLEHGDEPDFVKVLDFGLVKDVSSGSEELTKAGLFMGSPKYMAPEQITGAPIDGRTDIYALGVIMYELVTGKVPFDRPKSLEILMAHAGEEVPPIRKMNPAARISPGLEEAIMRSMAKNPNDRFRSMDEVLAALKRLGAASAADPSVSLTTDRQSLTGSGPTASRIVLGAAFPIPSLNRPADGDRGSTDVGSSRAPAAMEIMGDSSPGERKSNRGATLFLGVLAVAAGLAYAKLHIDPSTNRRADGGRSRPPRSRLSPYHPRPRPRPRLRPRLRPRPRPRPRLRPRPRPRRAPASQQPAVVDFLRAIARSRVVRQARVGPDPPCRERVRPSRHQASTRRVAIPDGSCPLGRETDLGLRPELLL